MTTTESGSLRIGMFAPPWFSVPPRGYGGIEWVVSSLTEGLVRRGHDVTLVASGGSRTAGRLLQTFAEPPSALLGDTAIEAHHLFRAYSHWREFDVIHDHTLTGLLAAGCIDAPLVHTVHGPVLPRIADFYREIAGRVHFVCISENQRSTMPPECDVTVIHNGIEVEQFPFSSDRGDYLLFVGRMSPEKGVLDAIEIARRVRMPLLVLAKINERPEREYFEERVRPAMAGVDVQLREQVSQEEKARAYAGACATLFPIHWPEPFGLVMTESMATGTPVIAYREGSVPEVVADGETGFVCSGIDEAVEAVARIGEIDRLACRRRVEQHFSAGLNVERHEALYRRLVKGSDERIVSMAEELLQAEAS
jgi:glycosyltransferase involved in cell wall biosynthesis